jgi:hypothetical protein
VKRFDSCVELSHRPECHPREQHSITLLKLCQVFNVLLSIL